MSWSPSLTIRFIFFQLEFSFSALAITSRSGDWATSVCFFGLCATHIYNTEWPHIEWSDPHATRAHAHTSTDRQSLRLPTSGMILKPISCRLRAWLNKPIWWTCDFCDNPMFFCLIETADEYMAQLFERCMFSWAAVLSHACRTISISTLSMCYIDIYCIDHFWFDSVRFTVCIAQLSSRLLTFLALLQWMSLSSGLIEVSSSRFVSTICSWWFCFAQGSFSEYRGRGVQFGIGPTRLRSKDSLRCRHGATSSICLLLEDAYPYTGGKLLASRTVAVSTDLSLQLQSKLKHVPEKPGVPRKTVLQNKPNEISKGSNFTVTMFLCVLFS